MRCFVPKAAAAVAALACALFLAASPARAFEEVSGGTAVLVESYDLGTPTTLRSQPPTAGSVYSNVDTFTGFATTNGGTVVNAGNGNLLTTRFLSDDLNSSGGDFSFMNTAGWNMRFAIANLNTAATSARFRLRFFLRDGAGGAPGTALGGISFATTSLPGGQSSLFTASALPGLGANVVPAGTTQIWAGFFFDNSGAAATTAAQMDNLGLGNFNPPVVGTSADFDFLSGTPTNTFLVNSPSGSTRTSPFAGNPVANYGFEITPAPEPGSIALVGIALIGCGIRRRRA